MKQMHFEWQIAERFKALLAWVKLARQLKFVELMHITNGKGLVMSVLEMMKLQAIKD